MTTTFRRTLASAAAATALLASFAQPSFAQTAAPAAPAAASAPQPGHAGHKRGDFRERMQQRIAKLKADLKLTPAQEGAWNTYAASFKPGERPQRMEREDFAKLTTPQRIDKMREMRAQRAAEADRRGEATKAFYAQLDANQQKTFDAATLHKGMHGHHGMDHGPRHDHKPGQARPAPAPAQ
ncbi:Domain of Uncharacterised Function (DUF1520) [Delftia tsuruhatensis]|uniref:Spy/CpxP family protein refolding chaperone n=1 Tax=Delftia tsuruhatensis TaxID=180282 RepID=UPI001E7DF990|nr:Spy/CpxP family protein refolding chaperone [Delftia tsuruhatensis]CAB5722739.1 Domain of Uncharacterised Function (DUF1520) [Delftia tsuruhatensis]CAC9675482.1 Domain of Uncharacterised Function (DUF1520) [Delftia tsuruhatensis]